MNFRGGRNDEPIACRAVQRDSAKEVFLQLDRLEELSQRASMPRILAAMLNAKGFNVPHHTVTYNELLKGILDEFSGRAK